MVLENFRSSEKWQFWSSEIWSSDHFPLQLLQLFWVNIYLYSNGNKLTLFLLKIANQQHVCFNLISNDNEVLKFFFATLCFIVLMFRFILYCSVNLSFSLPVPKVFVGVLTLMKIRSACLMASEISVEKNWKKIALFLTFIFFRPQ